MKIGVIGTGTVGKTLASKLISKGHQVIVANSRGPEAVAKSLSGSATLPTPGTTTDALACDLVFLAVPWTGIRDLLGTGVPQDGGILVDTTNIFLSYPPNAAIDDLKGDSGSEIIARLAPASRVVKAFNTLPFDRMFSSLPDNMKRALFIAGDDETAVLTVANLITELGLHPIPLGSLATAGRQMELGGPLSGLELLTRVEN